jgi:hypothetical protein
MPSKSLGCRLVVLAGVALLAVAVPLFACPFCSMQGQTLIGDVNQASMVLYGTFTNAKLDAGGDGQGTTELHIDAVIKKHEILGDKKVILVPRYVPTDKDNKVKFLVFCDVFKGKIDPYRGVPVQADSDMVKYLEGALAVKDKPVGERLRFYFDYLDNKEVEIANDAYKEFANADYKDYCDMARNLPADKIAGWLADPNTGAFRHGLYASMLGHCGTAKHAQLLRQMLDDPQKRITSGLDGMLAGYTMLQPKEGWQYVSSLLKDPARDFTLRYSALNAARFFWNSRPDLVSHRDLAAGVSQLLSQSDIADLAIEDLRKWGCWEYGDEILGLQSKKSHDVPIIRRAILRFALSCPGNKAVAYVDQCRKRDPETVKDAEELLKLENSTLKPQLATTQPTSVPLSSRSGNK